MLYQRFCPMDGVNYIFFFIEIQQKKRQQQQQTFECEIYLVIFYECIDTIEIGLNKDFKFLDRKEKKLKKKFCRPTEPIFLRI